MTEELLKVLDFPEKFIRKNTHREKKREEINPTKRDLNDNEKALIARLTLQCDFRVIIYHSKTLFNCNEPYPPIGYTAICHEDAPFIPHIYHSLFMGFAYVNIEITADTNWKTAIPAIIKDVSPCSPTKTSKISDGWIAALGRDSWVAICQAVDASTGDMTHCVYVLCGADDVLYNEMEKVMYECYQEDMSIKETMLKLEPFRVLVLETRKRILYYMTHYIPGITTKAVVQTHHSDDDDVHTLTIDDVNMLNEAGVIHVEDIPSKFHVVEGGGELCHVYDPVAKGLIPEMDIMLDDCVVHEGTSRLRLSNSCLFKGNLVRIQRPDSFVKILKTKKDADTSGWLHGFPALTHPLKTTIHSMDCTFHDRDQFDKSLAMDHTIGLQTLIPKFIHLSRNVW